MYLIYKFIFAFFRLQLSQEFQDEFQRHPKSQFFFQLTDSHCPKLVANLKRLLSPTCSYHLSSPINSRQIHLNATKILLRSFALPLQRKVKHIYIKIFSTISKRSNLWSVIHVSARSFIQIRLGKIYGSKQQVQILFFGFLPYIYATTFLKFIINSKTQPTI